MTIDLIFQRKRGGVVKVTKTIQDKMSSFKQFKCWSPESGGVIVGRCLDNNNFIFDDVSVPSKKDIRSRFNFLRKTYYHQDFVNEVWSKSDGTINYLGEWHTHPELHPMPSFIDRKNWKKLIKTTVFDGEVLFFIIMGIECLKLWEIDKNEDIYMLELVS
jgi:integrative and conjugative element protein (TIGR02256 family)